MRRPGRAWWAVLAGAGAIAAIVAVSPPDARTAACGPPEQRIEEPASPPTLRGCPRTEIPRETASAEDESMREEEAASPSAEGERADRSEKGTPPRWLQTVHVVTRVGEPVPGVVVEGPPADASSEHYARITDESGSTAFWCLEGRHEFTVRGFSLFAPALATVGALRTPLPVTVVLEDVQWVAGRVAYDGSGVPNFAELKAEVEGPDVIRWREGDGRPCIDGWHFGITRPRLATDGSLRIPVPGGWDEVEIAIGTEPPYVCFGACPDFGMEVGRARVRVSSESAVLSVSHERAMGVSVRVVDQSGLPVEGALLYVERVQERGTWSSWANSRTDRDGRATVFPLEPGACNVGARTPDSREGSVREVRVVGPDWPEVTIRVERRAEER